MPRRKSVLSTLPSHWRICCILPSQVSFCFVFLRGSIVNNNNINTVFIHCPKQWRSHQNEAWNYQVQTAIICWYQELSLFFFRLRHQIADVLFNDSKSKFMRKIFPNAKWDNGLQNERMKEKHPDDLKRISFGLIALQTSFLILYHPIKFKRPFNQFGFLLTLIFSPQLLPNVVPFGQDVVLCREAGRKLFLSPNLAKWPH